MARPAGVQITRDRRKDGSTTFGLRVRVGGADGRIPLGNSNDGWDEVRVETARKQLLAKIEPGLWSSGSEDATASEQEPTFRELATDWLQDRRRNPAIRPKTIELNQSQLRRYLLPFFGDLLPSQITPQKIKEYRRQLHEDNAHIRAAAEAGKPLIDPHTHQRIRTLGNESINKTLRVLAQILDEAEDAPWIDRNPARSRRMREPAERRRRAGALDLDEFISLLDAAGELDRTRHSARTLERANIVRELHDAVGLGWNAIAKRLEIAQSTAIYLYRCRDHDPHALVVGPRRGIIVTLGLAGPRVSELCGLDKQDVDLAKARLVIADSKTEAGVRNVDMHGRLLSELVIYSRERLQGEMDDPAFQTRRGTRRDKDNIRRNVIAPVVRRANQNRSSQELPPIHVHVTPHTFRRTYATYMLAAGHDIPYVQSQLGHLDPGVTLSIYAHLIRRPDRDALRQELRAFLESPVAKTRADRPDETRIGPAELAAPQNTSPAIAGLRRLEKAGKGRRLVR